MVDRNAECGRASDRTGTRDGRGSMRTRGGQITGGGMPVDPEHKADLSQAKEPSAERGSWLSRVR